jgi:AcrR family transcriptional regulator
VPRSPKDNQEIRDARREAILATATRVFSEKGFAQTKISEIAAAAGLSHGLVYHYFDSKDAILAAIADEMLEHVSEDLAVSKERAIDRIAESMRRSHGRIRHGFDANRVVMQAMLQGTIPPAVRESLVAHMKRMQSVVVSWIAEAQRDGDIISDIAPEELASAMFCLFRGMSIKAPGVELPFGIPQPQTIMRLLLPPAAVAPQKEAARSQSRGAAHGKRARRQ